MMNMFFSVPTMKCACMTLAWGTDWWNSLEAPMIGQICKTVVVSVLCQKVHHEDKRMSKQLGKKVIEKCESGVGYRSLNMPWSLASSVIRKWKEYETARKLGERHID